MEREIQFLLFTKTQGHSHTVPENGVKCDASVINVYLSFPEHTHTHNTSTLQDSQYFYEILKRFENEKNLAYKFASSLGYV